MLTRDDILKRTELPIRSVQAFGGTQGYDQTFSAVSANPNRLRC